MIRRRSKRGYTILLALLLAVVLTGYVVALLQTSVSEAKAAKADMAMLRATQIAETGIERARVLLGTEPDGFANVLLGCNGVPDGPVWNSDDGVLDFDLDGQADSGIGYANGSYTVRIVDNNDGDGDPYTDCDSELLIISQAQYGRVVTNIKIQAYRLPGTFVPLHAILTNGYLDLGGTADILGSAANVHSNADINIHGTPTIAGDVTCSGSVTVAGGADSGVAGVILSDQAEVPIPDLHAADFLSEADYIFKADGNVFDADGNFLYYGGSGGSRIDGWNYNGGQGAWIQSGLNPNYSGISLTGVLYFESDVHISGNSGRDDPWECTVISEGDIIANGNSLNQVCPNEDIPLIYFAEKDLQINGTASATMEGIFYAREQIKVMGTANIIGSIVAYNATSTDTGDDLVEQDSNQVDTAWQNRVLGNFGLQCSGDMTLEVPGDPNMRIRCWVRE